MAQPATTNSSRSTARSLPRPLQVHHCIRDSFQVELNRLLGRTEPIFGALSGPSTRTSPDPAVATCIGEFGLLGDDALETEPARVLAETRNVGHLRGRGSVGHSARSEATALCSVAPDTGRPITALFSGAPVAAFTVYGATPQRDAAVIGFSARTAVSDNASVYLR